MSLVSTLQGEAKRRSLLDEGERITPAVAFRLVRDMPYRRASDRTPETVLREWRGTCSGKHYLLRALLQELGMPSTVILATHEFSAEDTPWLPPHLMTEVRLAPVPDVHNFLRVQYDPAQDHWMTVDCTWPARARQLEMPANLSFETGVDQRIACEPIEIFHVAETEDAQAVKEQIIERFVATQAARRDAFIAGLSDWVARELGD